MGDLVTSIIKWTVRILVGIVALTALVSLLGFIYSMVFIQLNNNFLTDLVILLQVWLPFNLSVVFLWFTTVGLLYVFYRLTIWCIQFINSIVGYN